MMTYDQALLSESTLIRERTNELVFRSEALCRETQSLINASKEILGDLDTFLGEFDLTSEMDAP